MFDEQPDDRQHEDELEDKFRECMLHDVVARTGYDVAKSFGMSEEQCLKAAVIQLSKSKQTIAAKLWKLQD